MYIDIIDTLCTRPHTHTHTHTCTHTRTAIIAKVHSKGQV